MSGRHRGTLACARAAPPARNCVKSHAWPSWTKETETVLGTARRALLAYGGRNSGADHNRSIFPSWRIRAKLGVIGIYGRAVWTLRKPFGDSCPGPGAVAA